MLPEVLTKTKSSVAKTAFVPFIDIIQLLMLSRPWMRSEITKGSTLKRFPYCIGKSKDKMRHHCCDIIWVGANLAGVTV